MDKDDWQAWYLIAAAKTSRLKGSATLAPGMKIMGRSVKDIEPSFPSAVYTY